MAPTRRDSKPPRAWRVFVKRYQRFRGRPSLGADGEREPQPERGVRLESAIEHLWRDGRPRLPQSPRRVTQTTMNAWRRSSRRRPSGFGPVAFGEVWRAWVLDRDRYTCFYCHRNALRMPGCVTLRLELDHEKPRADGGRETMRNIRTACRTCNTARGRLSPVRFQGELRSLAEAVLRATSSPRR